MLESKSRIQIMARLEEAFRAVGSASFEEGCADAAKLLDLVAIGLRRFGKRDELEKLLASDQIPADQERFVVAAAEQLPALLNYAVRELSASIRKDLPLPPQGRPKSLTLAQEREVCQYIGKLSSMGVALKLAKRRAALRVGVSNTTVERIWIDRRKKERQPSLVEIIDFFKAD